MLLKDEVMKLIIDNIGAFFINGMRAPAMVIVPGIWKGITTNLSALKQT